MNRAAEQIPLLCGGCGGPGALGPDGSLNCPYCGRREQLPANELDRMMEMRRRLSAAAMQAEQCKGIERALFSIFESTSMFSGMLGVYFAFAAFMLVYSLVSAYSVITTTPEAYLPLMLVHVFTGPMFVLGLPVSATIALAFGRRRYRKEIRPIFMARPPETPGAPARCRVCGGSLPDSKDALLNCRYCHTASVVTPELKAHHEAAAAVRGVWHQRQGIGASAATTGIGKSMTRTIVILLVITYVSQMGCVGVASKLLTP
jgi:hypothetical protein